MTNINVAPYLDSVGIKVLINSVDISQYVSDVEFNSETKINEVTTFGYGVTAATPYGGTCYSPSIDISTFSLTMHFNQVAPVTGTITVALSTGIDNTYTYVGTPQLWSVMSASITTPINYITTAYYYNPAAPSSGWQSLTSGTSVQSGWIIGLVVNSNCSWTFQGYTSVGIATLFTAIGAGGIPQGVWNNRGTASTGNTPVPFLIAPAGNVSGSDNTVYTGNCYAPKATLTGKVGNAITYKVDFKVDGGMITGAA